MGNLCAKQSQVDFAEGQVCKKRIDCKVKDAYKLGKTLGTGGFAIVKLATDRKTGEQFAVKIMTLPPAGVEPGDNENTREDIFKEIDILCGLNHENVVYLKEYFEEGNKVYLITELVTGGELLEAVLQRGSYSEGEARLAFVQLLRGIQYLHSKHAAAVKIADFGLAKQSADAMSTVCGTPQYVAPEVIQGTSGTVYGPAVDMWSSGVVLFILLGGYPPFWSENEPALFEQIRRGKFSFDDPVWDVISHSAKDLITKLLAVHPNQRLTAAQCLDHPWVTAGSVPSNPLTAARNKMQALSMKAPGFAAAMAAAVALGEEAVATGAPAASVAGEMGQEEQAAAEEQQEDKPLYGLTPQQIAALGLSGPGLNTPDPATLSSKHYMRGERFDPSNPAGLGFSARAATQSSSSSYSMPPAAAGGPGGAAAAATMAGRGRSYSGARAAYGDYQSYPEGRPIFLPEAERFGNPPDLPSLLLQQRVIYISMPFLPSVTELVVAQCYYLDFDDKNRQKPIYVYLNSTGCINEQGRRCQRTTNSTRYGLLWASPAHRCTRG
ncbi:kinase-like domain-containing protein [Scenedesmus sp. NREL 46B-D3]|nr:kinase-like domain-containing protein [Scenedesmus sp. NREL 46B-D3]